MCCTSFLTQLSQYSSSYSFFVDVPKDLFELLFVIVKAFKDLNSLRVVVSIQVLREIRFEPELYIFSKVGYSNYNLISFGEILLWVETINQLNLYQVGSKPGLFSIEELHTNIVFELNLVVRGS